MLFLTRREALFRSVAFIILAALLVILLWPTFRCPAQPEDEGIALVQPEMFLKGYVPYRDFESLYGPGNLLILSGAYSLFGANIFVERSVGLIYRILILVAIFGIAQRWGTIIASMCALVAVLYVRDAFTLAFVGGCALALGLLARYGAAWLRRAVLVFLAAFSSCYALYDIRDDLLHVSSWSGGTDADALARATFIPAIVWGIGWGAVSIALLALTLRQILVSAPPVTAR